MSLRRRDIEQWMSHRRLPEELKRCHLYLSCYHISSSHFPFIFKFMIISVKCEPLQPSFILSRQVAAPN